MILKTNIQLLVLLLLSLSGFSQAKDCGKYREGKFRLTDPKTKQVSIITRKNDVQTEKMEEDEEIYDFNVKWLNDCTYTLTPTAATAARNKKVTSIGTMTVTISQVKDSSYIQTVKVANYPKFKRTDEMFLIKEKE